MTNLNVDTFISAASFNFLSTGDQINKARFMSIMVDSSLNIERKYASKIWHLMEQSGRIQNGIVCDITDVWNFDAIATVKMVLSTLKVDDSSYLTDPILQALHTVTGLSYNTIQAALNALENEYFIEQRRAVSPAQIIPRLWVK